MVRNYEKYEQAVSLRKRGFTYDEIAKYCEVSKSTASNWLKNKPFSEEVAKKNKARAGKENTKRLKLMAKSRSIERQKRYDDAVRSAETEFHNYKNNPQFIAGLMIYVTSGDHHLERSIRLTHTDVVVQRQFVSFCTQFLGVSKSTVHLWLHLYEGANEEKAMKYWSKHTKLPYSQFYKNHYIKTAQKQPLHFGVGNTIIASTYHKQKLLAWVKLAKKTW